MGRSFLIEVGRMLIAGLIAGIVAAALLGLLLSKGIVQIADLGPARTALASQTPGMDYVDAYRCPRGMTKLVQLRGVEDGFSRDGDEPATPRAALLKNQYYSDVVNNVSQTHGSRSYDETGTDKVLYDDFDVPIGGIQSVELVLRVRPGNGSENDYFWLGDFDESVRQDLAIANISFTAKSKPVSGDGLLVLPLGSWVPVSQGPFKGPLIDFINKPDRPAQIDFLAQDDTAIDFAALIACRVPQEAKGVTLREYRVPRYGPGISMMSCNFDRTQGLCDAFAGDMKCTQSLPLACYRPGTSGPPAAVSSQEEGMRHFVNGEIRLTKPVQGSSFNQLADANRQCEAEFGTGWRVLSYHEGGGGTVISRSDIAPRSRAWVDIRDQRYANCWDRDRPR